MSSGHYEQTGGIPPGELLPFDPTDAGVRRFVGLAGREYEKQQAELERARYLARIACERGALAEAEVRGLRVDTIVASIVATHALRRREIPPDCLVYDHAWVPEDRPQPSRRTRIAHAIFPKLREEPLPPQTRPVLMPGWRIYDSDYRVREAIKASIRVRKIDENNRTLVLSASPHTAGKLIVAHSVSVWDGAKTAEQLRSSEGEEVLPNPTFTYFRDMYPRGRYPDHHASRRSLLEATSTLVKMFGPSEPYIKTYNPWQEYEPWNWEEYRRYGIEEAVQNALAEYVSSCGINLPELYGITQRVEATGVRSTVERQAGIWHGGD